jgi:hypothetical protein
MDDAATLLGPADPLAQALARRDGFVRQVAAVVLFVALDVVAGRGSPLDGAIFGAGVLVAGVLLFALLVSQWLVDERAVDAIIAGYEALPVPSIARTGRRLASPRRRRSLARSLEQAAFDAGSPFDLDIAGEIEQVARILCTHAPGSVRGVALVERLVRDGIAALPPGSGGREVLRRELGRIRYELTA